VILVHCIVFVVYSLNVDFFFKTNGHHSAASVRLVRRSRLNVDLSPENTYISPGSGYTELQNLSYYIQ
jgi:hypothetical protein